MPVRLRLARHGQRNTPYYHIVAINSSKRRDAQPLEKLGEYDPIPRIPSLDVLPSSSKVFGEAVKDLQKEKKIIWNVDRIQYWLSVGAQPTKSVVKLLERGGVLQTPHRWQHAYSPPPAGTVAGSLGSTSATTPRSRSSSSANSSSFIPPPSPITDPSGATTGFSGATAS